ncbi:MAG: gliding motility-associated peptidyl-prolyl isomerase GldI [Flavobacteriaceae bacterium]|nr:gliding motility-associated peptidyl-prolyl isomerase GldI [Flavobacteriaceae bacterium]
MRNSLLLLFLLLFLGACTKPTPRHPVSKKSSTFLNESIERNKEQVAFEEMVIRHLLDSLNLEYRSSGHGFYYRFINEPKPLVDSIEFGDEVTFSYDLQNLTGTAIYSQESLSPRTYLMEKEPLFSGLREGLKLMQEGDTVDFIFPSYTAYGYYGDQDKIGKNTILKSRVTITNVKYN